MGLKLKGVALGSTEASKAGEWERDTGMNLTPRRVELMGPQQTFIFSQGLLSTFMFVPFTLTSSRAGDMDHRILMSSRGFPNKNHPPFF